MAAVTVRAVIVGLGANADLLLYRFGYVFQDLLGNFHTLKKVQVTPLEFDY